MPYQCQKHSNSRPLLLVADDEPVVRDIVRSMAESSGYEVLLAVDATEAQRLAERFGARLGAVLLDLNMPGMSPAVSARVHELARRARVLIITGEDRSAAAGCTAHEVLLKPFTIGEMQAALAPLLEEAL